MKIKKSLVVYLVVTAIVLTVGGFAYHQVVKEQTPVSINDEPVMPQEIQPNKSSSMTIDDQPLTISGQKTIN